MKKKSNISSREQLEQMSKDQLIDFTMGLLDNAAQQKEQHERALEQNDILRKKNEYLERDLKQYKSENKKQKSDISRLKEKNNRQENYYTNKINELEQHTDEYLEKQLEIQKEAQAKLERKYNNSEKAQQKNESHLNAIIAKLKAEQEKKIQLATNKQAIEDAKEYNKQIKALEKELEQSKKKIDNLEIKLRETKEKYNEVRKERDSYMGKYNRLKDKYEKQFAPKLDSHNSNKSSSHDDPDSPKKAKKKKKNGKKQGGQKGHPHHSRTKLPPTKIIIKHSKYEDDPNYEETGDFVSHQRVFLDVVVEVREERQGVYRNIHTDELVYDHTFSEGFKDDVSYDESIQAFVLMILFVTAASSRSVSKLISIITKGVLNLSNGYVASVTGKFRKMPGSQEILDAIDVLLLDKEYLHVDDTYINVAGKQAYVKAVASEKLVKYYARQTKSAKSLEGTILTNYSGIVVCDGDLTINAMWPPGKKDDPLFVSRHKQLCLVHVNRKNNRCSDVIDAAWLNRFKGIANDIIEYCSQRPPNTVDIAFFNSINKRYDEALDLAAEFFENNRHDVGIYKDAFTLYKSLIKNRDSLLLCLRVPNLLAENNRAERALRPFKRIVHNKIAFQSTSGFETNCDSFTVLRTLLDSCPAKDIMSLIIDILKGKTGFDLSFLE